MCISEDATTKSKSTTTIANSKTAAAAAVGGVGSSLPSLRASSTISSSSMCSHNSSSRSSSSADDWNDSPLSSRAQDDDDTQSFESSDSNNNNNINKVFSSSLGHEAATGVLSTTNLSSNENFQQTSRSISSHFGWFMAGIIAAAAKVAFSLWFPFALAPHAANATYDWAFYSYDTHKSHFDNTIWTYGTDYGLGIITASLAMILIHTGHGTDVAHNLVYRGATLLLLYCASVLAGGYAHQTFLTLESRNTIEFRILWTICVGTVCAASTAMGMSGSDILRQLQQQLPLPSTSEQKTNKKSITTTFGSNAWLHRIPVLPDTFWITFGMAVTVFCAWGGLSFQRPACDIFVAGITQTPSTFYVMIAFGLVQHPHVTNRMKIMGLCGFIFNAPLLPAYPLLVQYTDLSLAAVNTLLHCNLCTAWTMQGLSMIYLSNALIQHESKKKTL